MAEGSTGRILRALSPAPCPAPELQRDADVLSAYVDDASSSGPGQCAGLIRPASEGEAAAFLRETSGAGVRVLPQAARSSLTGGASPRGEVIVSSERMTAIGALDRFAGGARVDVDPGVRLKDLQRHLAGHGFYYPPVPTYQEAMVGGTVSTNAGGAATFKYGVTRDWVDGLRVVLHNGDVLDLRRGDARAMPGERFRIELADGRGVEVPAPRYTIPKLKKLSAGYFASSPLDLVDLFVGSEGTLGWISRATLRVVPRPATVLTGLAFVDRTEGALGLAAALRDAGAAAASDRGAPDVRAVEWMDSRCLALLRAHGDARRTRVEIPPRAQGALLFEVEFRERLTPAETLDQIAAVLGGAAADGPLPRLLRILHAHSALEDLELALPDDDARQDALREFREAVPRRVNELLGARRRDDPGVQKVGGDLIVPFDHVGEMIRRYVDGFERRGLEYAIWGHLSDGNLHPNAIPASARDTERAREAQLEFAAEAARRGGSPLSEHGVGRSALKQEILRRFLGDAAIAEMRGIKASLDPEGRFAPGVLFPA